MRHIVLTGLCDACQLLLSGRGCCVRGCLVELRGGLCARTGTCAQPATRETQDRAFQDLLGFAAGRPCLLGHAQRLVPLWSQRWLSSSLSLWSPSWCTRYSNGENS